MSCASLLGSNGMAWYLFVSGSCMQDGKLSIGRAAWITFGDIGCFWIATRQAR
ncbi:MAG: hypothetical protein OXE85_02265 [Roseovarius sp.]|nr:hypothetical protein [Roseovarius sp.]